MTRRRKGQRADGLIQVSVTYGHTADGKRLRKVFYGHTKAEAEKKKADFLARSNNIYNSRLSVSEWIEAYLSTYTPNINPLYYQSYTAPYKHIQAVLGARSMQSVRELDLQAFLNSFAGRSFSFNTKLLQAVRRVFRKAYKNHIINSDPSDDLALAPYTKGTHRALSHEEIAVIVGGWSQIYSGLWIMIMLFTGLRRGEMMALDWEAVDLSAKTLTVRQTAVISHNQTVIQQRAKTEAGLRTIPVPNILYKALSCADRKEGPVCVSAHGRPLSECAVSRGLERACAVLGLSFRWHDLRHTYATMLYESGVDVKTAAYLLGHSDISVTMKIYTHLSEQMKLKSTAKLADFLALDSKSAVTPGPEPPKLPDFIDVSHENPFGSGPKGRRFKSCHLEQKKGRDR